MITKWQDKQAPPSYTTQAKERLLNAW